MIKTKYLILGAGPAGLSFASKLKLAGENDFLVLEKETTAGGLCRSVIVDNSPFDIGGGHFLDTKDNKVTDFLFRFMPRDEWSLYVRDSRIEINGCEISYPLEANIWQMDIDSQVEYLKSIAIAGCNANVEMPAKFTEWIVWKLGSKIADDYMLPYNRKMFGKALDDLGTYWLGKLPNVSFEDTLRSCIERRTFGKLPAHAEFYYPKRYGYGEVWRRMAECLDNNIMYGKRVVSLDITGKIVNSEYKADYIINTCPWNDFNIINADERISYEIGQLMSTSIVVEYENTDYDTDAQWIYVPDIDKREHRLLIRKNFIDGARGYWKEINADRYEKNNDNWTYYNQYAYPLNSINKPKCIKNILNYMQENDIYGLGRWGEWEHLNSDVVVRHAMNLERNLALK